MSVAYISLGSNLGDRQKNLDTAIEKLRARKNIEVGSISTVIETDPEGDPSMPKFLNNCVRIDTTLYPDELLSVLKSIEREMGIDPRSQLRFRRSHGQAAGQRRIQYFRSSP